MSRRTRAVAVLVAATVATSSLALASAMSASAASSGATAPVTVSAGSFVDSVGVNVHMYYSDTAYADTTGVTNLLQGLGVRHVRDGLAPNRPDQVAAIDQLGAAGIRSTLILSGTDTGSGPQVDPAQLDELSTVAPYVDAVEPTNEYDCSGDSNWAAHLHSYAQDLVQSLQSSEALRQLGILAPAFCRPDSVAAYGDVTGTASATNAHDYSGGQAPELALESRLPQWAAIQQPDLPMVVTETGFHNALASGPYAVTEASAADYTVRTLLDAQRLGIPRTYLYELLDEKPESAGTDPEQHYGLVRSDGTVKPAYTAVQGLLSDVTGDATTSGPAAPVSPLSVGLQGGGSLLRSLLITDPSGTSTTLALWLATPVENTSKHTKLSDPARTVRVTTDQVAVAKGRLPSRGNAITPLGVGTSFDLSVSGAPLLVRLTPTTRAITASCTVGSGYPDVALDLGATTGSALDATAGWTSAPGQVTDAPGDLPSAAVITGAGQRTRITVPGTSNVWTIAVWERTDATSAPFATFLQVAGASGALLRTYDLTSDTPSHVQISGYGLPVTGLGYGGETWGQAQVGTWHLVALSVGGSNATLSIDGVVQGTVPSAKRAVSAVDVGAVSDGFRGALAGLQVFPRVLSADELGRLATAAATSC